MLLRRRSVFTALASLMATFVVVAGGAVTTPAAATVQQPGTFVSVAPTRLLDTRTGTGAPLGAVAAGGTVHLQVTGGIVPTGAVAAVLNVTVVTPGANGYLTVYPDDAATRPAASNLNFSTGQTIPNLVFARIGANGKVAIYNGSLRSVQILADVSGYFVGGGTPTVPGAFVPLDPHRQLDTRTGTGAVGPVPSHGTVTLPVTGGVVPSGATAVVLNVTVTRPGAGGYITVWGGGTRPAASNLNFSAGQTIPNLVVTPVDGSGNVRLYNGSLRNVDLIGDISGYFLGGGTPTAQGAFVSLTPTRLLDTRTGTGAVGPVPAHGTVALQTTGATVPAGASAAVMNVTVVTPGAGGYITVYGDGTNPRPAASNLNFSPGETIPNLAVAPIGTGGKVDLYNGSLRTVQLLSDVSGYFIGAPADTTPPGPVTGLTATASSSSAIHLSWTNPADSDFAGVKICRAVGATAPTSGCTPIATVNAPGAAYDDTGRAPSTQYSYSVFTFDTSTNLSTTAVSASATTLADTTAPANVTNLTATPLSTTSIRLDWTNPADADFAGVLICRNTGSTAPTYPCASVTVPKPGATYTDSTGLTPNTQYTYSVFAADSVPNVASGASVTATTLAGTATGVHGTVTDTSGTPKPLAGVVVDVFPQFGNCADVSCSNSGAPIASTTTAADGTYQVAVAAGTYRVCFNGAHATTTGSTTGFTSECYNDAPWSGLNSSIPASAAVAVANGSLTTVNAALGAGGAISGTATAQSGGAALAGVQVLVFYVANGHLSTQYGSATTAANGTYTVSGLAPLPTGYAVCFEGGAATGGTSTAGYLDECYLNVAWDGASLPQNPTLVPVSAGTTATGINATLTAASGISGTVTAAAGGAPLAGVNILVFDSATGNIATGFSSASTAANGTYKVTGLPPSAGGYRVCFDPSSATGGTSTTGYLPQCWNNVAWDGVSSPPAAGTLVPTTAGATAPNINAALGAGGAITGTVTATTGGGALAGVQIQVYDSNNNYVRSATTAANGTYTVRGLVTSASYHVCFEARSASGGSSTTGYVDECWNNLAWDGQSTPFDSTPVAVTAGSTTSGINASLASAGGISGKVTAATGGAPLAGVYVALFDPTGELPLGFTGIVTAADGTFSVKGLAPGTYHICFDGSQITAGGAGTGYLLQCWNNVAWDGSDFVPASASGITVTGGAITPNINAALASAASISGTVTAATGGAPLANATVLVYQVASGQLATNFSSVQTAADGTYHVYGLIPGSYDVCFQTADATGGSSTTGYQSQCYNGKAWDGESDPPLTSNAVVTTAGTTTANINAIVQSGAAISGTVTDSSGPVAGVDIALYDSSGNQLSPPGASTAADGTYKLTSLQPGAYFVCFQPQFAQGSSTTGYFNQCYNAKAWDGSTPPSSPTDTVVNAVAGSTVAGVNALLGKAGALSGTVTDSGGAVRDVQVAVFDSGSNLVSAGFTATDGTYKVTGLATGSYFVCFDPTGAFGSSTTGYRPQCYSAKAWDGSTPPSSPTDTTVAVTTGATTPNINAVLAKAGAISGTVTDGSGPVSGVNVEVFASASADSGPLVTNDTALDGTYTVTGLAAGTYFVCFDAGSANGSSATGYLNQCYNGQAWNGFDTPASPDTLVTVALGSTRTGTNAVLTKAGAISGSITDVSAGGISNVFVDVFTTAGDQVGNTSTDDTGAYEITGVAAGNYLICFDASQATGANPGGYFSECYNDQVWDGFTAPTNPPETLVSVSAGAVHGGVNAVLAKAGGFSGTLTDASGPVSNVDVEAYDSSGGFVTSTTSGADGKYTIGGLLTGTYHVCFFAADGVGSSAAGYLSECYNNLASNIDPATGTPISVTTAVVTPNINAQLAPAAGFSGTATATSGGLYDLGVSIYTTAGVEVTSTDAQVGDNGHYQVGGLPAGSYYVCFNGQQTYGDSQTGYQSQCYSAHAWDGVTTPTNATANAVAVATGVLTPNVNVTFALGDVLAGTVTDATDASPVSGAFVYAYNATGGVVGFGQSDDTGAYSITGMTAGSVFVCFDPSIASGNSPTGYASECYHNHPWDGSTSPTGATATGVSISGAGATTTVNESLARI